MAHSIKFGQALYETVYQALRKLYPWCDLGGGWMDATTRELILWDCSDEPAVIASKIRKETGINGFLDVMESDEGDEYD